MTAVMISIQPKWVEKIVSGEKTIEVRKTAPKIETPFKCYIYCTKINDNYHILGRFDYAGKFTRFDGKVIGEFICDKIYNFVQFGAGIMFADENLNQLEPQLARDMTCLTDNEIENYLGNKDGYGWHISNLKIYDKPKEISEFKHYCDGNCKTSKKICQKVKYYVENDKKTLDIWANCDCLLPLTRPPQSWCYIEE